MPGARSTGSRLGAYGFSLRGISSSLLVRARATWPELELVQQVGRAEFRISRVSRDKAEIPFETGGGVLVERAPARATFTVPTPLADAELVHPYLGTAAAIASYWRGQEIFHAGAFVAGGGAWAVLGERQSGKSSLLAWLELSGRPVVSDDIVVVDHGIVFAGPRSVDLRESAAAELGVGKLLGVVGARERWRLALGPVDEELELRGWILLSWGDTFALKQFGGGDLLTRLAGQRAVRLPPEDPGELLRLSVLPAWELQRPRDWKELPRAGQLLLAELS